MREVALRVMPVLDEGSRPLGEVRLNDEAMAAVERAIADEAVLALSPVYQAESKRPMGVILLTMHPRAHTEKCSDDDCPCYLAGQEAITDEIGEAQAQVQQAAISAIRALSNGRQVVVAVEDLAVALFADGMEATDATRRLRKAVEDA